MRDIFSLDLDSADRISANSNCINTMELFIFEAQLEARGMWMHNETLSKAKLNLV